MADLPVNAAEAIARTVASWEQHKKVDLVFEGGGVLGVGLAGAYSVIDASGFHPQNVAGTSAGAIVASLVAAGYSGAELRDIMFGLDFSRFMDPTRLGALPFIGASLVGEALSVLFEQGLYKGDYIEREIEGHLAAKGIRTFGDLVYDAGLAADDPYRYKLQVIASDVTNRCLLRLPLDAPRLGLDPDRLPVARAVRMSMSIPFFFVPVRWPMPQGKQRTTIVDGGMLSNFPIWLFDSAGIPEWPTIGVKFTEDPRQDLPDPLGHPVQSLVDYVKALIATMMEFHDRLYLDGETFARTITVPTQGVSGTNFNLTAEDKQRLFEGGQQAAGEFFQRWSFAGYVAAYRSAAPVLRHSDVSRASMEDAAAQAGLEAKHVQPVVPR
jgi:NTE family protein